MQRIDVVAHRRGKPRNNTEMCKSWRTSRTSGDDITPDSSTYDYKILSHKPQYWSIKTSNMLKDMQEMKTSYVISVKKV